MEEANHEVAAHILIRSIKLNHHFVAADAEATSVLHFFHGAIVGKSGNGGFVGFSHVNLKLGITPILVGFSIEGHLVDGTINHVGKCVGGDDELALGDVVNIITINRHVAVGGGAVVDGERESIGGGEGDTSGTTITIVAAAAVGFNAGVVLCFGGEAGEVDRYVIIGGGETGGYLNGTCEVGSGAVFKHPIGLGAAFSPTKGSNRAVARGEGGGQTCGLGTGGRSIEGEVVNIKIVLPVGVVVNCHIFCAGREGELFRLCP